MDNDIWQILGYIRNSLMSELLKIIIFREKNTAELVTILIKKSDAFLLTNSITRFCEIKLCVVNINSFLQLSNI